MSNRSVLAIVILASLIASAIGFAILYDPVQSRIADAVQKMMQPAEAGQAALVAVWDSNAFVQCRRGTEGSISCEAAGTLMQPSLAHILTPRRQSRIAALGWRLDPSFGNYAQVFPSATPPGRLATLMLKLLVEGYGARPATIEIKNSSVADEPCPPRNGPSQNMAGKINNSAEMADTAIHACSFTPVATAPAAILEPSVPKGPARDLVLRFSERITAELHRLRGDAKGKRVYMVLDTGAGYVQCEPEKAPPSLYCEAASVDSWPELAPILTPDHVARLHQMGFADPGRRQNYYRYYKTAIFTDRAIARALLTLLHDAYGYDGTAKLTIITEHGRDLL